MVRPDFANRLIGTLRTSTGAKMFLILTLALLPLGLIALFASLQASRIADVEKAALLRGAAQQSARKLAGEMISDRAVLRLVANTLARGTPAGDICGRTNAFFVSRGNAGTVFAIYARDGRLLCASAGATLPQPPVASHFGGAIAGLLPREARVELRAVSDDGRIAAVAFYDRPHLAALTDPATALQDFRVTLSQGDRSLDIGGRAPRSDRRTTDRVRARVEPTDIVLTLTVVDPPPTLARVLSLSLPLVMWLAAALIGWAVVHRLLIQPLSALNRNVAAYRPGEPLEPMRRIKTPAQEIQALGDTFRGFTERATMHEADMAAGLARQRRLTREVHHRVKNNLQIIASLINLHSRSAPSADAAAAYGSIQRRVDALSVVHRNHYAELEENRGLSLRSLVSELSASLRGSAPDDARGFGIQVRADNLFVSQDVAVPVAFLITELVELALLVDPAVTVRIAVQALDPAPDEAGNRAADQAELTISSPAFVSSPTVDAMIDVQFARVLTGLSRQLRAVLERDAEQGSYRIRINAAP